MTEEKIARLKETLDNLGEKIKAETSLDGFKAVLCLRNNELDESPPHVKDLIRSYEEASNRLEFALDSRDGFIPWYAPDRK